MLRAENSRQFCSTVIILGRAVRPWACSAARIHPAYAKQPTGAARLYEVILLAAPESDNMNDWLAFTTFATAGKKMRGTMYKEFQHNADLARCSFRFWFLRKQNFFWLYHTMVICRSILLVPAKLFLAFIIYSYNYLNINFPVTVLSIHPLKWIHSLVLKTLVPYWVMFEFFFLYWLASEHSAWW